MIKIDQTEIRSLLLVRLSGEFSFEDVPALHKNFHIISQHKNRIVLEFCLSGTVHSALLEPLIKLAVTSFSEKAPLIVAHLPGDLHFIITMLKLNNYFEFHESVTDLVMKDMETKKQPVELETEKAQPVFFKLPNVTDFKLDI